MPASRSLAERPRRSPRQRYAWETLSDDQLLSLRFCDLNLSIEGTDIEEAIDRLKAIRGIGEWTAQYIALRAIREMDAFPATDVGLLRGAAGMDRSAPMSSTILLDRAESWRPWRAYAAQHLWAADPTLIQEKGYKA